MALTGTITLNAAAGTQQIIFANPSTLDSITYSSAGFTYPISLGFTLSLSDIALFLQYKIAFYNALFYNFPNLNSGFNNPVPFCNIQMYYSPGSNHLYFNQTSGMPILNVYNISIHNGTLISTFAARSSAVTITPQEYLNSYQVLLLYLNQCLLT